MKKQQQKQDPSGETPKSNGNEVSSNYYLLQVFFAKILDKARLIGAKYSLGDRFPKELADRSQNNLVS